MYLSTENQLNHVFQPWKRKLCVGLASGLCMSGLMLSSALAIAQQSGTPGDASDSPPVSQKSYRSAEGINPGSQPPMSNLTPYADNRIANAAITDPAAGFLSQDFHPSIWFDDDTWITGVGTLLFRDDDGDGYYSGFGFTIDADTRYQHTEVYAAIDIQRSLAQRERLHTSANFSIYGNSLSDEYRIDIDLLSNYQAGDYDVFIDLHDAYDHSVLDSVSAADFSNLYSLPLESEDLDYPHSNEHDPYPAPHPEEPPHVVNDDIYVVEYAGSSGLLIMLAMLYSLFSRTSCARLGSCRKITA